MFKIHLEILQLIHNNSLKNRQRLDKQASTIFIFNAQIYVWLSCIACCTSWLLFIESLLPMHNNGKKHQRLLKASIERQASAEKSIYVRGFPKTDSLEGDLCEYFSDYGDVVNVFVDKEKVGINIILGTSLTCAHVWRCACNAILLWPYHPAHTPVFLFPATSRENTLL